MSGNPGSPKEEESFQCGQGSQGSQSLTVTYLDIARSYERFLCPEVGQEGSNEEPRRERVPRTGRPVIDLDPE
eukprot:12990892-Heterocapsa_arctica.AAC.1